MPMYDYVCRDCGRKAEILVRSASQKVACPACSSRKMDRQFSTFAAHSGATRSDKCPAARTCPSGACARGGCPMA